MRRQARIMYIEYKGEDIVGPARIGRVTFSKTGRSLYYKGKMYIGTAGRNFKSNYIDEATRDKYWISGCKKDGTDALYSTTVEIDDDVREEYWRQIRKKPEMKDVRSIRFQGKYGN